MRDNFLNVENQASTTKVAHACFALLEISVLFALIHLSSAILPPYIGGDLHHEIAERDELMQELYFSMGLNYSEITF